MEAVEAALEKMEAARDGRFRSAVARYAAAAQEIDSAELSVMRRKQSANTVNRRWNYAVIALAKLALGIPNDLGILFKFNQNYYEGLIAAAADGPNRVARALADVAESERFLKARKDEFIWPTLDVMECLREEYKICQRRRMCLQKLEERMNFAGQFSFVENLFGALTYPILGITNAGFTWVSPKCFMVPSGRVLDDILEGGYFGLGINNTYFHMQLLQLGFTALGAGMYQSNSKNFVVGRPDLLPYFGCGAMNRTAPLVDDNEEDFNNDSSIRTFTATRLDNNTDGSSVARNSMLKIENSTGKSENVDGGIDGCVTASAGAAGATAAGGSVAGIMVKEDTNEIFTENIQTSGAYSAREESFKREEEAGRLKFKCLWNDGIDEHMVWLIGLKNIFTRQLPNMPKEYIVRLVMDISHKSVMVIRSNHVVGGITYRPYVSQRFGEIAFCAITSYEQVKGYGTRLMNHLKQHARDVDGLTHFLTYADNNAVGYFVKQGFTKEIHLEKDRWHGYIKDYDGGILMECRIDPKLPYTDLSTMIRRQRQAIDEKIKELSNCHIVYPGINFQKKEAGVPKKTIKFEDIPGLRAAGWTPDQWGHSRFGTLTASTENARKHLTAFMRALLKSMHEHVDAWPFKEPVDARDIPDYYEIIKDPMDLRTMSKRVESEQYYVTFEMFVADAKRMFANARTYNSPDTIYYKCATRLEAYFQSKVQSGLQSGAKIQ